MPPFRPPALSAPESRAFTYQSLREKYGNFSHPMAKVLLGQTAVGTDSGLLVSDIHVEVTSGFEASEASFRIYGAFEQDTGKFLYDQVKKDVLLGNSVTVQMGYLDALETVFVGFVCGAAFGYEPGGAPYIEVTGMDVKGLMMGGTYANQLAAATYSGAVREILSRTGEGTLADMGILTAEPDIRATPDAESRAGPAGAPPKSGPATVEMVSESDYEFVVRAAKRYNFEFFVDRGRVLFRPAKCVPAVLTELGVRTGLRSFRIQYSLTGVVKNVEARAMDPGRGEAISARRNLGGRISAGKRADRLIGKSSRVCVDASITSAAEASARADALMERMSYRLGSLEAECVGMPDLVPGRFIEITGMGAPADNRFYLTSVIHDFTGEDGFTTRIEGCADSIRRL